MRDLALPPSKTFVPVEAVSHVAQRVCNRARDISNYKNAYTSAAVIMNSKFSDFPNIDVVTLCVAFEAFEKNIDKEIGVNKMMTKNLKWYEKHSEAMEWKPKDSPNVGGMIVCFGGYLLARKTNFNFMRFSKFAAVQMIKNPVSSSLVLGTFYFGFRPLYNRRKFFTLLNNEICETVGDLVYENVYPHLCYGFKLGFSFMKQLVYNLCYMPVVLPPLCGKTVSFFSRIVGLLSTWKLPVVYVSQTAILEAKIKLLEEKFILSTPVSVPTEESMVGVLLVETPATETKIDIDKLAVAEKQEVCLNEENGGSGNLTSNNSVEVIVNDMCDVSDVVSVMSENTLSSESVARNLSIDALFQVPNASDSYFDYMWSQPPVLYDGPNYYDRGSENDEVVKPSYFSKVNLNQKRVHHGVNVEDVESEISVAREKVVVKVEYEKKKQEFRSERKKYNNDFAHMISEHLGSCDLLGLMGCFSSSNFDVTRKFVNHKDLKSDKKYNLVPYKKIDSACPLKADSIQKGVVVTKLKKEPTSLDNYYIPDSYEQIRSAEVYHFGPSCTSILPAAFAPTLANERVSLSSRHIVGVPEDRHNLLVWKEAFDLYNNLIFMEMRQHYHILTMQQWMESLDPKKKALYEKYISKYDNLDFDKPSNHHRSFFIKAEMQLPGIKTKLETKAPRGIQALQKPEMNMALGPFIGSVSHAYAMPFLSVDIDSPDRVWPQWNYTSGGTNTRIGQWYHDMVTEGRTIYEDDFSSYDSTQGIGAHSCEVEFFLKFDPPDAAITALQRQSFTKGYGRGHYYSTPYTRKSGDQNTSVGNTHVQFVAHSHCVDLASEQMNVIVLDVSMVGLGDDNLLAIQFDPNVTKATKIAFGKCLEENIIKLGLKPKLSLPENHSYCSGYFMPCKRNGVETRVLIPCPVRKVAKMGWCPDASVTFDPIMRSKGNELGNPINAYVPISRVFYDYYTSLKGTANVPSRKWYTYVSSNDVIETGSEMWNWFESVFGVTKSQVADLEQFLYQHIHDTKGGASFWSHPVMDTMIVNKM